MKKKILYFMPDNPTSGRAGNLTRAKATLDYFCKNSETIDFEFCSVKDWGDWDKANFKQFKEIYPDLKLHLFDRKIPLSKPFQRLLGYKIPNFFYKLFQGTTVDISGFILKRKIRDLIDTQQYDFVIISYAVWGSIIKGIKNKPYLINDTHDFITAQSRNKKNKIGKLFQSEINILSNFDEIWTYSIEEEYIFEQFTHKKVQLIPVSFPLNFTNGNSPKKYDIIYVASANPHNITGINWFLKEVLPFLTDFKIHIIGKICTVVDDHENVVKHGLVDDLDDFYKLSKVAVCPMRTGTGIKIKVVEALSYGIPVVTNRRGVDGLVNKSENGCLVTDDAETFAENIKKLLTTEDFYKRISSDGEKYFRNNHDPKIEEEILNKIFK